MKKMKVYVLSKKSFDNLINRYNITNDNVENFHNIFFISINDTSITDTYFENKSNVKVMFFDDAINNIPTKSKKAFTKKQSKELYGFIKSHSDKEMCIVHCSAGISRSGAVGTFVNDFNQNDYNEFKRLNPIIQPNSLVLRLLRMEYYNDPDINPKT